jgi:hypothetical protein
LITGSIWNTETLWALIDGDALYRCLAARSETLLAIVSKELLLRREHHLGLVLGLSWACIGVDAVTMQGNATNANNARQCRICL